MIRLPPLETRIRQPCSKPIDLVLKNYQKRWVLLDRVVPPIIRPPPLEIRIRQPCSKPIDLVLKNYQKRWVLLDRVVPPMIRPGVAGP